MEKQPLTTCVKFIRADWGCSHSLTVRLKCLTVYYTSIVNMQSRWCSMFVWSASSSPGQWPVWPLLPALSWMINPHRLQHLPCALTSVLQHKYTHVLNDFNKKIILNGLMSCHISNALLCRSAWGLKGLICLKMLWSWRIVGVSTITSIHHSSLFGLCGNLIVLPTFSLSRFLSVWGDGRNLFMVRVEAGLWVL